MLVLFTDTDCDVTPSLAEELGYKLISMPYEIQGKSTRPYVDFDKFDPHPFYEQLRKGILPNTYALNPFNYREYFEPIFKNGDDILYVHFSSAMSGTFNAMRIAIDELKEEYPDRNLYEIDTRGITILSLNIVYEVSRLYKEGKSLEEILHWAKEEVDHFTVYFFAEDLNFFKHSGRVSGLAAFFGTLIGIRPIMFMDADGKMKTCGKEHGRKNACRHLVNIMKELGDNIKDYHIIIGNTDFKEGVDALVDVLKQEFGEDIKYDVVDINPTIGSHCGPNALGLCFHSTRR